MTTMEDQVLIQVLLFKLVFIQAIEGIKSMRQTCKKIKVDAEYRCFLGIPFGEETPHLVKIMKEDIKKQKYLKIYL